MSDAASQPTPPPPPGDGFWISKETVRILVKGAIGLAVVYLLIRVGADPSVLGPILKALKL
ncbi:hypothetical protein [Nonomuraea zeae]|uniref:DUF1206 domain-containing protein n=1 Tax=Nonomuraea zeae TaxID=1642303 RepID=A0A5S4FYC5_9ACTN|nr:hypothetical protein [Nonomuraea zeae]TMR25708.1 hypothetical protein ETD85_45080 [Nonomuraea zeae]